MTLQSYYLSLLPMSGACEESLFPIDRLCEAVTLRVTEAGIVAVFRDGRDGFESYFAADGFGPFTLIPGTCSYCGRTGAILEGDRFVCCDGVTTHSWEPEWYPIVVDQYCNEMPREVAWRLLRGLQQKESSEVKIAQFAPQQRNTTTPHLPKPAAALVRYERPTVPKSVCDYVSGRQPADIYPGAVDESYLWGV